MGEGADGKKGMVVKKSFFDDRVFLPVSALSRGVEHIELELEPYPMVFFQDQA